MVDLAEILQSNSLDKRELLNSMPLGEIVAELPVIFSSSNENVACKGLEVLKLICEGSREPEQAKLMVSTALYALENPSPDVHARALDLLKRFAAPLDPAFAEELRQRLDNIATPQRPAAESLLATARGAKIIFEHLQSEAEVLAELETECANLDERWRRLAGCDQALSVAKGEQRLLEPLKFAATDVARLDPSARFQSIREPDELMDLFMRGFNMHLTEAEIERVLDGVSNTPKPPDTGDYWEARLSGLSARAKRESGFLGAVALAWAFGTPPEKDQFFENLLHKRVIAVANQLGEGKKVYLLATPTHSGSWIDPRVLVERAKQIDDVDKETTLLEQVQSLLRLAPEHRDAALSAAGQVNGEYGRALRFALGSRSELYGDNIPLWVAAIRARNPLTEPYCMKVKLKARDYPSITRCLSPSSFETETAILIEEYLESRPGTHEMVALIGDMDIGNIRSPLCTEVFWARQFREVSESRESSNNYWQEDGWEHLFDPDLPIGGMAMHSLIYALNAICSDARAVSTKILIRAIYDGRIDGVMIGTTVADHYSDLLSALWLEALHEVACASPLHAEVIHCALETILAANPFIAGKPDNILLRELLLLSVKIGYGITSDTARNYLDTIEEETAAREVANELLAIQISQFPRSAKICGVNALRERIKRANRWQAWHRATSAYS